VADIEGVSASSPLLSIHIGKAAIAVLTAGFFKNTGQKTGQEFGKYRTIYRTHQDIHSHCA